MSKDKVRAEDTALRRTDVLGCKFCGRLATCVGAYEGSADPSPACDECCLHGNEDGWCHPVAEVALWLPRMRRTLAAAAEQDAEAATLSAATEGDDACSSCDGAGCPACREPPAPKETVERGCTCGHVCPTREERANGEECVHAPDCAAVSAPTELKPDASEQRERCGNYGPHGIYSCDRERGHSGEHLEISDLVPKPDATGGPGPCSDPTHNHPPGVRRCWDAAPSPEAAGAKQEPDAKCPHVERGWCEACVVATMRSHNAAHETRRAALATRDAEIATLRAREEATRRENERLRDAYHVSCEVVILSLRAQLKEAERLCGEREAEASLASKARSMETERADAAEKKLVEVERELRFYKEREAFFTKVLQVVDGGRYRNDWEEAIKDMAAARKAAERNIAEAVDYMAVYVHPTHALELKRILEKKEK